MSVAAAAIFQLRAAPSMPFDAATLPLPPPDTWPMPMRFASPAFAASDAASLLRR